MSNPMFYLHVLTLLLVAILQSATALPILCNVAMTQKNPAREGMHSAFT
jgi:hypothetical protein